MANAFMAISDDGTAASWNPAGLAQLRKPELSIVGTTSHQSVSALGFRSGDGLSVYSPAHSSYQNTFLDFASLAVPFTAFGKPLTFQASWRRLYTLEYRENVSFTREPLTPEGPPPVRMDSNNDALGSVDTVSVAGAAKLSAHLAFGLGVNFWRGDWSNEEVASAIRLDAPQPPASRRFREDNRIRGENFAVGLMLTFPRWSVGLVHQSPLRSDYEATASMQSSASAVVAETVAEGTLRFARGVGVGGAWRPATAWTVALDFTWDDWSGSVIDTPVTGRVNLFDGLPAESTVTRDTLSINAGAERLFLGEGFVVPLRFGAAWEPQGGRSPYTLDRVDYVMLAVGGGYNTNRVKLDAALQYRWGSFLHSGNIAMDVSASPYLPAAVGERHHSEWRLKFSLILRLTESEKGRPRPGA
jgi:long-subunit fatty acid transport protein